MSKIKNIIKFLLGRNTKFKKISYSQCGEDLIVKFIFDSIGINKPSYIDIGAHHPSYINNTAIFHKNGSRGINIEPDPSLFKEFTKVRKKDINLNIGVGPTEGLLDFYIISSPTLNSFSKEEAMNAESEGYVIKGVQKVKVLPLEKIITEFANGVFPDFLSLDVEGFDMEILESIDYEKNAPIIICVETIAFSNLGDNLKDKRFGDFLLRNGYLLYADTYINTIFVKKDRWINRK